MKGSIRSIIGRKNTLREESASPCPSTFIQEFENNMI